MPNTWGSDYLPCFGGYYLIADYPDLYFKIGLTYGIPIDPNYFAIPDFTGGRFVRSTPLDNETPGVLQGDAIESHTVSINDPGHTHEGSDQEINNCTTGSGALIGHAVNGGYSGIGQSAYPTVKNALTMITAEYVGASETRPVNISLIPLIRARNVVMF